MPALLGEPLLLPALRACLLATEASDPHQNLGLVPRAALRLLGALPPTTHALLTGQRMFYNPGTCFVVDKGLHKLSVEVGEKVSHVKPGYTLNVHCQTSCFSAEA